MMSPPKRAPHQAGLVTIVVPAKDEERAIGRTLRSLPVATLEAMGLDVEVLVLDGASRDQTADIARACGATVVPEPAPGKGAAFTAARPRFRGETVVMLDADGTYAPDAIPRVLGPLAWGDADVVMGRRVTQPGSMRHAHRLGNRLLSLEARSLFLTPCPDLCTGLWAFRAPVLRSLPLASRGFELEAELFALSIRLGHRVVSVDVDYLPREGEAKLSSGRDGLRIGWWLLRSRFVTLPPVTTEAHAASPRASRDGGGA